MKPFQTWTCVCGRENSEQQTNCSACRHSKILIESVFVEFSESKENWICPNPQCNTLNPQTRHYCWNCRKGN